METFDEARIIARLEKLDRARRAAFALACADRLDGFLDELEGRDLVRTVRELLRRTIADSSVNDAQLRAAVRQLEASEHVDEDAVASTVYACRAWLTSSSQESAWAARRAYEAFDQIAQSGSNTFDEPKLLSHPLVQREIESQLSDLRVFERQA